MNIEEIKENVESSVKSFMKEDAFLLENNLNERTLTHRLACHLEKRFSNYNVDCEYNRMWNKDKGGHIKKEIQAENIQSDDDKGTTVFPDIVIHNREGNERNLLVIEVKKNGNATDSNTKKDKKKIEKYCTGDLRYECGLFLLIAEQPRFEWFKENVWEKPYTIVIPAEAGIG